MLIVMQPNAGEAEVDAVIARLVEKGFDVHRSTGAERTVLGAVRAREEQRPAVLRGCSRS